MNDTSSKAPMGGWLIIFIAMYTISAAQSLLGLWPSFQIASALPSPGLFLCSAAVIAVWNAFILYCMACLILRKPDAVRLSKLMLLSGPVIAALTPLMGLGIALSSAPDTQLSGQLFAQAYSPEVMGQITGMALLSLVWYRFLSVSKRVAGIWGPEGELAKARRSKDFFDALHERPAFDIEAVDEGRPEGKREKE